MGNKQTSNVPPPIQKAVVTKYASASATMANFDLTQFLGEWYEISYSKNSRGPETCTEVKMTYSRETGLDAHGDPIPYLKVVNQCTKDGVYIGPREGRMVIPNKSIKSKMITYWQNKPNVPVNYWVYWTDYKTAAVTGNGEGTFYIIGRKPKMEYCQFARILDEFKKYGANYKIMTLDKDKFEECQGTKQ